MDMRDGYGNKVGRMDETGNPIQETHQPEKEQHQVGRALRRSGSSSSSSSSEDDGMGGRRKKEGLKKKLKEKLPGGHKTEERDHGTTTGYGTTPGTTTTTGTTATGQHEPGKKKGMMEKIKEKLPGTK